MQKTALVIMAAGIGSRFGEGIKQLAPVGQCSGSHHWKQVCYLAQ